LKKIFTIFITLVATLGLNVAPAFAHAVVKPSTAGVGAFTDFSLGVPSEKDAATVKVQLIIPAGLKNVSPIVKSAPWKVEVKQVPDPSGNVDDDGKPAMVVSEIDWTGGSVPAHQKDFFMISAQVPAQATELDWKVVQTYSDGSVVNWDKTAADQPKDDSGKPDFSKFGPYSKTMVVNDLNASPTPVPAKSAGTEVPSQGGSNSAALWVGIVALVLAIIALGLNFMPKKGSGASGPKPV
jgi:uncharacterized protein YcnI